MAARSMSEAQRNYEAKRAAKAGMSLEKWMASKARQDAAATRAKAEPPKPAKPPGLLSRLLERAHRPL